MDSEKQTMDVNHSSNDQAKAPTKCTTNAQDLAEAEALQVRLSAQESSTTYKDSDNNNNIFVPTVSIDEGAHKYVLIKASTPSNSGSSSSSTVQHFVFSKQGADYHRNVAEHFIPTLQTAGYYDIRITGGGRILKDSTKKLINIYGYSYGFGMADHSLAVEVVEASGLFEGYTLNWSNDGY